jgi:hypothetical protein
MSDRTDDTAGLTPDQIALLEADAAEAEAGTTPST